PAFRLRYDLLANRDDITVLELQTHRGECIHNKPGEIIAAPDHRETFNRGKRQRWHHLWASLRRHRLAYTPIAPITTSARRAAFAGVVMIVSVATAFIP